MIRLNYICWSSFCFVFSIDYHYLTDNYWFSCSFLFLVAAFKVVLLNNFSMYKNICFSQKPAAKPLQAPQNYSSSAPYVGSGAPSSMYLGMPPYGSSLFNGSSIPPYDVPFSGGSAYHYNYGSRLSAGSPYRPLHMSGPPPYSGGSMMGNGFTSHLSLYCFLLFLFPS